MLKLVAVGDHAVGKTCLFIAYDKNTFPVDYVPTVFDNYVHDDLVTGIPVSVTLWDTSRTGEDYDRLRPMSYPQTDVFLVCFSVDSPESLDNVKTIWVPELRHYCPETPIVLVACKIDLREKSPSDLLTYEEGSKVAKELDLSYIETSARSREGLQEGFATALELALQTSTITTIQPWCMCCKRTVLLPPVMPPAGRAPKIEIESSKFAEDWMAMHENPVCADVTFVLIGQYNLDAHKIVLCSASEYFRRLFSVASQNQAKGTESTTTSSFPYELNSEQLQGIVAVYDKDQNTEDMVGQGHRFTVVEFRDDIKPKTFVRVLQFLYSGVPNLTNELDQIDTDNLVDVMKLSEIFNLPRLMEICQNCLANQEFLNPSIGTSVNDETKRTMKCTYFNKPVSTDVIFKVEGIKIYAHKIVLAARCKILFTDIKSHDMKSTVAMTEVEIPDTSARAFLALLEYLYTDYVSMEDVDKMELIALADKYGQRRLVNLCELCVIEEVNKSVVKTIEGTDVDVVRLLQASQNHNADQLSNWCLHFLSTNYTVLKNKKEFSSLTDDNRTYIEENQWPPLSYLRDLKEYKRERNKCSLKCVIV